MLRFHSIAWIAALAVSLLVAQDSFAQKGGRGGGGGARISGGGGAIRSSPSIGSARPGGSISPLRTAPSINTAPRPAANLSSPRINSNLNAARPSANLNAQRINPNLNAARPSANLNAQRINPNLNAGRPSNLMSNNNLLNRGAWNGNRFDNNRFFDEHNHHHNGFFSSFFFFNPGFFGAWPWNAAYPYYDYYYGGGNPSYAGFGVAQMPWADYNPGLGFGGATPLPQAVDTSAQIDVLVPDPNTQVWFDGNLTRTQGTTRYFDSPSLQPGGKYTYTVRAAWNQNGQPMTAQSSVNVTAGSQVVVDFTQTPPRVIQVR